MQINNLAAGHADIQRVGGIPLKQPMQGLDIDDRGLARDQRIQFGMHHLGMVDPGQGLGHPDIEIGERPVPAPQDLEKRAAIGDRKKGRNRGGLVPERLERRRIGGAAKGGLDVIPDLVDFFKADPPDLGQSGPGLELIEMRGNLWPIRGRFRLITIHVETVGDGAGDVGLGQQVQLNRISIRHRVFGHGETGYQTGAFALALRIDFADIVKLPAGPVKIRRQSPIFRPGQNRDQKGFTRLTWPEHAHRHFGFRRFSQALGPSRGAAQGLDKGFLFRPDLLGIFRVRDPIQRLPRLRRYILTPRNKGILSAHILGLPFFAQPRHRYRGSELVNAGIEPIIIVKSKRL